MNQKRSGTWDSNKPDLKLHAIILSILILLSLSYCGCSNIKSDEIDLKFKVYVPNLSANTITVIPPEKSKETENIDLDKTPQFIIKVPSQDQVWSLISGGNEITVIDSADDSIVETFRFDVGAPSDQVNSRCIFTSDGSKAYFATSYEPAGIAVMKVSDRTMQEDINVNSTSVKQFFFSASGDRLYCVDPDMGKIYVINTVSDNVIDTIEVPESFIITEYNTSSGNFYMAESGNDAVVKEFNPTNETFVERVEEVADSIVKMILSSDRKTLYVLASDELVLINLEDYSIDERIDLDYKAPTDFQFLPDNSYVLIPSSDADLLMITDPEENFDTKDVIDTGGDPGEIIIFDN